MRVLIPSALRSYTGDAAAIDGAGSTLDELTRELDQRYPGMRFRVIDEQGRIRQHIKFFVNAVQSPDLNVPLKDGDEVMIVCALSGG